MKLGGIKLESSERSWKIQLMLKSDCWRWKIFNNVENNDWSFKVNRKLFNRTFQLHRNFPNWEETFQLKSCVVFFYYKSCVIFWILKSKSPFRGEELIKTKVYKVRLLSWLISLPSRRPIYEFPVHFRSNFRWKKIRKIFY